MARSIINQLSRYSNLFLDTDLINIIDNILGKYNLVSNSDIGKNDSYNYISLYSEDNDDTYLLSFNSDKVFFLHKSLFLLEEYEISSNCDTTIRKYEYRDKGVLLTKTYYKYTYPLITSKNRILYELYEQRHFVKDMDYDYIKKNVDVRLNTKLELFRYFYKNIIKHNLDDFNCEKVSYKSKIDRVACDPFMFNSEVNPTLSISINGDDIAYLFKDFKDSDEIDLKLFHDLFFGEIPSEKYYYYKYLGFKDEEDFVLGKSYTNARKKKN